MSSSSRPHRVKSKTFTLHLDSGILEKLTMEAEEQGLSVNVIANRALKKHLEWDAVSRRFRVASTFSSLLVKLMTCVLDEYASHLVKSQWFHDFRAVAAY